MLRGFFRVVSHCGRLVFISGLVVGQTLKVETWHKSFLVARLDISCNKFVAVLRVEADFYFLVELIF